MIYCLFYALLVAGLLVSVYAIADAIKNAK